MSATDPVPELAQIEAIIAAIDRDARHAAGERSERRERRGTQARAGRMGPDWQEVQRRIDAGETTVEDVFTGRDETPAARRLVEQSEANLTELGRLAHDDDTIRGEVAELDQELAEWDVLGGPPPSGADPVGAPGAVPATGIRSATDPTAGVTPADGASPPARSGPGADAVDAPRDPVADRVDATGLKPPTMHDSPTPDEERPDDADEVSGDDSDPRV